MKNIILTAIFMFVCLIAGYSNATYCAAISDSDVEAYVTHTCSPTSNDGKIRVQVHTGYAPYQIIVRNQSNVHIDSTEIPIGSAFHEFDGLSPGVYLLKITDGKCGVAEMEVEVGADDPIHISSSTEPICQENTGIISLDVTGGHVPYNYLWSTGAKTKDISGLNVGVYQVTVTDAKGCSDQKSIEIKKLNLQISGSVSPYEICYNDQTASISLTIVNGTPPYSFKWSNGLSTKDVSGLIDGEYSVTVTDHAGCTGIQSFVVNRHVKIAPAGDNFFENTAVINSCNNQPNGIILLKILSSYNNSYRKFSWTFNGEPTLLNTNIISNLAPGEYCAHVVVPNNCGDIKCFTIRNIDIKDTEPVGHVSCNLGSIGIVEPLPFFTDPDIQARSTYKWSFNPNYFEDKVSGLSAGTYIVTITNNHPDVPPSCQIRILTYTIEQLSLLSITGNVTNGMQGGNINPPTGKIELMVSGGSGQFTYIWSRNNQTIGTTRDIENLFSGTYSVTVSDIITGCTITKSFVVNNYNCNNKRSVGIASIQLGAVPPFIFNDSDCKNENPKKVLFILNVKETDVFPFKMKIVGPKNYSKEISIEFKDIVEDRNYYWPDHLYSDLIPYTVYLSDACGMQMEREFWLCASCQEPTLKGHTVNFHNGLRLILNKPCKHSKGFGFFSSASKIDIDKDGLNLPNGLKYIIFWPDGNSETHLESQKNGDKFVTKKIKGSWSFTLPKHMFDGPKSTIRVERSDGCVQTIDLTFGQASENVRLWTTYSMPIPNVITSSETCIRQCNLSEKLNPPVYVQACANDSDRKVDNIIFKYKPNNYNAPCQGGGTFIAHKIVNGQVKEKTLIIAPGEALIRETTYEQMGTNDPHKSEVVDGGGCLFEPLPLFGANLNKDVYVNWWRIKKETEPLDENLECPTMKITNSASQILIVIESSSLAKLDITYPDKTTKSFNVGGKTEFTFIKTLQGTYYFNLRSDSRRCKDLSQSVRNEGIDHCPYNFKITPSPFVNDHTITFESSTKINNWKIEYINSDNIVSKTIDNKSHSNLFEDGINTINNVVVNLNNGTYSVKLSVENCPALDFPLTKTNIISDDPPEDSFAPHCNDLIYGLIFDTLQQHFEYYWHSVSGENHFISGAATDAVLENDSDPVFLFNYQTDLTHIQTVRRTPELLYLYGTHPISGAFIATIDNKGSQSVQSYPDRRFESVVQDHKGQTFQILYYVPSSGQYVQTVLSYDGKTTLYSGTIPALDCDKSNFNCPKYNFRNTGVYTSVQKLSGQTRIGWHSGTTSVRYAPLLPQSVDVKDVQEWQGKDWLVSGTIKGVATLSNGITYDSEGFTNLIFIWYDQDAKITKVIQIQNLRNETLTHVATDAVDFVAYKGVYLDTISYGPAVEEVQIEKCNFGNGFRLNNLIPACPTITILKTATNGCVYFSYNSTQNVDFSITFSYFTVINGENILGHTETAHYSLQKGSFYIRYCPDVPIDFDEMTYSIQCSSCHESCQISDFQSLITRTDNSRDKIDDTLINKAQNQGSSIRFFPNPYKGMVSFSYEALSNTTIKLWIYNILGNKVEELTIPVAEGTHIYPIPEAAKLLAGVYVFRIKAGLEESAFKVIKIE